MIENDCVSKQTNAIELICEQCGKKFIFRTYQQNNRIAGKLDYPHRCYTCFRIDRKHAELEQQNLANEKWEKEKAEEVKKYVEALKMWNVVNYQNVVPASSKVLYIIGNGFDLMHRVKSSYRDFSKTLGRNSGLRFALEQYLEDDDIWADFEDALAKLNISGMADESVVDMWLDTYDVYNPDGSAADYFLAIESAANPIQTIVNELPGRFRGWVERLSVGTSDRPLAQMFSDGKVLCFNYTEFVEGIYGVPEQNVCYIHGCRRKRKGCPKEALVLGHLPGASSASFDNFSANYHSRIKDSGRRVFVETAQDNVLRVIRECDDELTKNSRNIIQQHMSFFEGLGGIEEIIVIGHSYSKVDWDYFKEIVKHITDVNKIKWYFGCHSLRDLNTIEVLAGELKIPDSCISIFRTDIIKTTSDEAAEPKMKERGFKKRCVSPDGKWSVLTHNGHFEIFSQKDKRIDYEAEFPYYLDKIFFTDDSQFLVALFRGIEPGVCIFKYEKSQWIFVGELETIPNQCLINNRLKHVYVNGAEATFVYNNMVRVYSLESGDFLKKDRRKYDSSIRYEGIDVLNRFFKPLHMAGVKKK